MYPPFRENSLILSLKFSKINQNELLFYLLHNKTVLHTFYEHEQYYYKLKNYAVEYYSRTTYSNLL